MGFFQALMMVFGPGTKLPKRERPEVEEKVNSSLMAPRAAEGESSTQSSALKGRGVPLTIGGLGAPGAPAAATCTDRDKLTAPPARGKGKKAAGSMLPPREEDDVNC